MDFLADGDTDTNIWVAASDGDMSAVQTFMSAGISVNSQDEHGYSPLHAAVSYGHVELIQFLLSQGADIHIVDEEGDCPLLICEDPEVLELLLSHGAQLTARNAAGEGIVEKVVEDENDTMIDYLVSKGVCTVDDVKELKARYNPEEFSLQELMMRAQGEEEEGGDSDDDGGAGGAGGGSGDAIEMGLGEQ